LDLKAQPRKYFACNSGGMHCLNFVILESRSRFKLLLLLLLLLRMFRQ